MRETTETNSSQKYFFVHLMLRLKSDVQRKEKRGFVSVLNKIHVNERKVTK